jgi:small conductance mechanosensitive channel
MPDFDFNFELSALATGAVKVLLIVVVTLVLLWIAKRAIRRIVSARIPTTREESPDELSARAETLSGVASKFLSFVVWIIAFMMILSVLGINVAPIIAAVGLAGLAVGFALQNIIRDYFHGFLIIMEDWFRVGEVVSIAGEAGVVESIALRRTVLRDLNGTMHVIPNGKIELASNMARDWARINFDVSVGYGENLDNVIRVIDEVCQNLKEDKTWGADLTSTPHVERVNNLGDSGIDIKIMADVKPGRQWALTGELRKRLKERFDEEGIEIPWPHTKVHFGNALASERSRN